MTENKSEEKDWSNESTDRPSEPILNKITPPAYHGDKSFYKAWIHYAGWTLLLCVAGMIGLSELGDTIPEGLIAVASGVVGMLGGIFAAKPSHPH